MTGGQWQSRYSIPWLTPGAQHRYNVVSHWLSAFKDLMYRSEENLYEGPGKKPLVWSVQGCGPDVDGVYVPSEWKDIVIRASSNGAAVTAHHGVDRAIDYVKRFCSLLHESCQARNAMLKKAIERDVKSASDEAREPVKQLRERVRVHKQVERMSDAEAAVFEVELKAAENMYLPEGMQDSLGDDEENTILRVLLPLRLRRCRGERLLR
ncbi:hypothetical protein C8R43DRAFT_955534 [Mycena crocata]|nr:hypothetical protein C8R43DRAFT_955534 [Mycena crocata]